VTIRCEWIGPAVPALFSGQMTPPEMGSLSISSTVARANRQLSPDTRGSVVSPKITISDLRSQWVCPSGRNRCRLPWMSRSRRDLATQSFGRFRVHLNSTRLSSSFPSPSRYADAANFLHPLPSPHEGNSPPCDPTLKRNPPALTVPNPAAPSPRKAEPNRPATASATASRQGLSCSPPNPANSFSYSSTTTSNSSNLPMPLKWIW